MGAGIVIAISWFGSSSVDSPDILGRLLMGGTFVASCLFGISLAFRPGWIKGFTRRGNHSANRGQGHGGTRKRRGHHPDCEGFEAHVINRENRTLCAGCTGLAIGSIVSIFLMIVYVFLPATIPPAIPYVLVTLGMIFIAFNFLEIAIPIRNALLHLTANVFLVVSFLFIVIGVFQLTGSTIYGIVGIVISFLWLDTRVQLSKWRHAEVCGNCTKTCKAY